MIREAVMFDLLETTEKSMDVETILFQHLPSLQRYPFMLRRLLILGLRALVNEERINQFCAATILGHAQP